MFAKKQTASSKSHPASEVMEELESQETETVDHSETAVLDTQEEVGVEVDNLEESPSKESAKDDNFTPMYFNGRKFNSMDEWAEYTNSLEERTRVKETTVEEIQNPKKDLAYEKKLSDLMFEDPDRYTEEVQARAETAALKRLEGRLNEKQAWESFFKAYPDMIGNEDLVDLTVSKLSKDKDFQRMETSMAAKVVATQTRKRISQIRGTTGETATLPSGKALTAGGGANPLRTVAKPKETTNFVAQLKKYQKR